jgi:hypothetical protein
VHGQPEVQLRFEIVNLDNVWNGTPGSVAKEWQAISVSDDGRNWRVIDADNSSGVSVRFAVTLTRPQPLRCAPRAVSDFRSREVSRFDPLAPAGRHHAHRPHRARP